LYSFIIEGPLRRAKFLYVFIIEGLLRLTKYFYSFIIEGLFRLTKYLYSLIIEGPTLSQFLMYFIIRKSFSYHDLHPIQLSADQVVVCFYY